MDFRWFVRKLVRGVGFDLRRYSELGDPEARERRASADPLWRIHRMAVGDRDGVATLNLAGNSLSSSLLEMLPAHADSAPESAYVGTEAVPTRRLDGLFESLATAGNAVFLKIDTQGFERQVLEGAAGCLDRIATLQVEMSLVPLYAGAPSFDELLTTLASRGYELVGLEPGFAEPATGRLLQADGLFHRYR